MRYFTLLPLLATVNLCVPSVAWAQNTPSSQPAPEKVRPGDAAKNLKLVPPWTMQQCLVGRDKLLLATYDMEGARALRLLDANCVFWQASLPQVKAQLTAYEGMTRRFEQAQQLSDKALNLSEARVAALVKDLKKEIAEKNEYKYKPTYGWLYVAVGGAIALAGTMFGVGVWLAKD